jgi:cyclopropane-fatty-acyl-phospholipid synthase
METDYSISAECAPPMRSGAAVMKGWSERAARFTLLRLLRRIDYGALRLRLPDGEEHLFTGRLGADKQASLLIRDARAITRLLRGGDIGFAESYMDGEWETPDLVALIELASRNEQALQDALGGGRAARLLNRLWHWRRNNNRRGSRRNIAFHYDLGNDFYRRWLDQGMTYSSALFEHPQQDLAQAQQAKYQRIAELAELQPGARVLEIGCGWGGFMELAAGQLACRVEGVTLSQQQLAYANARMQAAGLQQQAQASLTDYRDTAGQYDAIVSIEMLEAVGEAHWPRYFQTLYERLKPGSGAVVQVITIADERYAEYRRTTDFIQRHVFPGGMLPSPSILRQQAEQAGLQPDHAQTFGLSYARTLAQWRAAFIAAWPHIAGNGFDQRFRRLWEYYLCYCEAGFNAGMIDVGIYRFRKPR